MIECTVHAKIHQMNPVHLVQNYAPCNIIQQDRIDYYKLFS